VNVEFLKHVVIFNLFLHFLFNYSDFSSRRIFFPPALFFLTLVVFIYGRVVLDVFGLTDLQLPNLMTNERINDIIASQTLLALIIFLSGVSIGATTSTYKNHYHTTRTCDARLFQVGVILFWLGIGPAFYIQLLTIKAISSQSYLAIFRGDVVVEVPTAIRLCAGFFRVGFILILASFPRKSLCFRFIAVFSIFIILNLLTGIRGYYLSFCLVLMWYWFYVRKFGGVSFVRLLLIATALMLSAQILASIRDNNFSLQSFLTLGRFFYEQSTSFLAVVYGVQYSSDIGSISYFNLLDVFVSPTSMIQDRIDYQVNPGAKDMGHSLGGGIIQEHVVVGGAIGLFLFAVFWYKLIFVLSIYLGERRLGVALLLVILPNVFFSPRARTFDFIEHNIPFVFVLIFVYFAATSFRAKQIS